MEDPFPTITVEPTAEPVRRSRPGPVFGVCEGVFQSVASGEYSNQTSNSRPDNLSGFSHPTAMHTETTHSIKNPSASARSRSSSDLLIYYQNVGGMNSNVADYLLACSDGSYDIIALSETWLNDRTLSVLAFGPYYEVFRCDRGPKNSKKTTGGGVLLAVHRDLKAHLLQNELWDPVEQVWVSIQLVGRKLFICAVYLPPDRSRDTSFISSHTRAVEMIVSGASPRDEIVVLGDYNIPGIKWRETQSGFLRADAEHSIFHPGANLLLNDYSTATLQQINNIVNENGRVLDLCFVSNQDVAPRISEAPAPLVKLVPHHPPLHLVLEVQMIDEVPNETKSFSVKYNFKKADFTSIVDVLSSIDWANTLDNENVNAAVETFTHIMSYVIDRHVPKYVDVSPGHLPWQTPALKRLKTAKRAALRKYSRHRTYPLRAYYQRLNQVYKRCSRQCIANYRRRIQQQLKRNPKHFWKYVREQRKESGLPSSLNLHGEVVSSAEDVCRLFSTKFSRTYSNEHLSQNQIAEAANIVPLLGQSLSQIDVDDMNILTAATKLKQSTSLGPDGVPSVVLIKCINGLLAPLRHIFQLSLYTGAFPRLWKTAYMFPVHKKGDRRNIDNYRGISALCATSKLFELVVLEPLFFQFKQYISDEQHGYMPKRSTTTNLLTFTSYVTNGFAKGTQTDAIYTDLSAAFDKINHDITLAKLQRLGIHGSLLKWIRSYLTGRQLNVKIDDIIASPFIATSGVPQGSHLGPLIFILYFNDVNLVIKGPRLSYADDMKIFYTIRTLADAIFLQQQLFAFARWCCTNRMVLNPNKCSIVTYSWSKNPIVYAYQLSNTTLLRENSVKDLGVILDSKLTFKLHNRYIVDKASRNLGFIFRTAKDFTDIYCLKSMYCSLVRSTLEYCSAVWNPHYQNGAESIESIQRRFIRFALRRLPWRDPLRLPSYKSRCQLIDLDTLQIRRDLSRALFVSDLLTSRIDCPSLLEHVQIFARPRALRNHVLLRPPLHRTNYTGGAINGLQRMFNLVSSGFDLNISRDIVKRNFLYLLRHRD